MERAIVCPEDDGQMNIERVEQSVLFKNEEISYFTNRYVCKKCGLEISTIDQSAEGQKKLAEAYRKKVGLLTGQEIREERDRLKWTQNDLAEKIGAGIASIKRWENVGIQTKAMDTAMRLAFRGSKTGDVYTGNREFSIPRVALVLKKLEEMLGSPLFSEKGLFTAKYLWYADMLSFYRLGRSLTGSTYAALPMGPQLNNYSELLDDIKKAKSDDAEPLTNDEERIIRRIAILFPDKHQAFNASHREPVWIEKSIGALIPYSDAERLTEINL